MKLPPAKVTERQFTATVIAFAQLHGWLVAHFRPARTEAGWRTAVSGNGKGFPDLLLVHPKRGRVVAAELKVGRGCTTPEQGRWLAAFSSAGVPAYVWTENDWPQIEEVLK